MAHPPQSQISEESQREKRKMSELNNAIPGGKRGLYNILIRRELFFKVTHLRALLPSKALLV